ncbi:hydroxymethylglutaryl-CoA synthase family protein [Streptomyces shenzhenensis]|uniref:hydroxymethylglutaryl-CoA synthase family protein n=1 Tax=Streptomyces shenzhenensis TaxID=943815 RepID=UPI0033EBADE5
MKSRTARRWGIDDLHAYCGIACVDVHEAAAARQFDAVRAARLEVLRKTVALPCEDAVSYAVNAARPLLDRLGPDGTQDIELLIVGTESGVDYSKSLASWVHALLGLSRRCRFIEVKQACYAGFAGIQFATSQLPRSRRPGARALVIGVDVPPPIRHTFEELSTGAGAVAALVAPEPRLLALEPGTSGYHCFDVSDLRVPSPAEHLLDPDASLLSYVECLKGAFRDYAERCGGADVMTAVDHLVFHTPFPGAVRGAHRALLRSFGHRSPQVVTQDFDARIEPSVRYPALSANLYAGTTLLALMSLLESGRAFPGQRVGIFSYGSGCAAEFCDTVLGPGTGEPAPEGGAHAVLEARTLLDQARYDKVADAAQTPRSGVRDYTPDLTALRELALAGTRRGELLMLSGIHAHRRDYAMVKELV